ncbi:proton-coupled folate transporter [Macrosteles quadrilineatus]|uniref:proton-coupled folate transporter n=1 Tax=Macrosteles quadrilineatus TaxID=74068 RepID=UPI0023E1D077|nr:proton-coupled folate transporter [Macrosteles quadrilineatus]
MEDYYEFNDGKRGNPPWWAKISVEPVMFLYMGSYMVSSVVEQAFFVHKACMVDVGLPADVCANISAKENEEYNKRVQVVVSTFHQYEGIASHIVPMILAFYLGAWSDRVGRKLTLLLGLFGSLYYWIALIVNSLQETWPLQTVLYTATFPAALTGSSLAIFMSAISYLCDITTPEERTVRVTLLEAAYLLTMPTGVAVGSYLFKKVLNGQFTLMFCVSGIMMLLSIFWAILRLQWCTNKTKQTAPISCVGTVRDTLRVVTKSRPDSYALYLRIIVFAMAVYTFQRDEKNMTYLYTILKFNWNVQTYSTFRTFQSSFFILGLLVGAPILGKMFGLRDTVIVMIGAASHCVARVVYALASQPVVFYVGGALGALGPIAAPVLRSIVSKLVPASERGKAFSLLSVADTSVPILSSTIYSQLYNATIDFAPASIFWVTVFTQLLVFGCALAIQCIQGSRKLEQAVDPQEEVTNEQVVA